MFCARMRAEVGEDWYSGIFLLAELNMYVRRRKALLAFVQSICYEQQVPYVSNQKKKVSYYVLFVYVFIVYLYN